MNLLFLFIGFLGSTIFAQNKADLEVIAKIREEGFQNSQVMEIAGYISDVHGNKLVKSLKTLSCIYFLKRFQFYFLNQT